MQDELREEAERLVKDNLCRDCQNPDPERCLDRVTDSCKSFREEVELVMEDLKAEMTVMTEKNEEGESNVN